MRKLGIFLYALMFFLSATLWCVEQAAPQAPVPAGNIICHIPPEPVVRNGANWTAKEITGTVTIQVAGKTYTGTLTFPDTTVRRTGIGTMRVDACVATGTVK